ncbi:hypothetical protein TorRG33x02_043200 [Trema orientale]|uniref:Uncharacterized protein n=1 Tax=Trema orientale TaxID=63057 RepID=A0A2P5FQ09_TREOI|nr:hypothetical protein TorRG33x02_043200 [Trema orientale]
MLSSFRFHATKWGHYALQGGNGKLELSELEVYYGGQKISIIIFDRFYPVALPLMLYVPSTVPFNDPTIAEVVTVRSALEIAEHMRLLDIVIERDAAQVLKCIDRYLLGNFMEDRDHEVDLWEMSLTPCEINCTAHNLALWNSTYGLTRMLKVYCIPVKVFVEYYFLNY